MLENIIRPAISLRHRVLNGIQSVISYGACWDEFYRSNIAIIRAWRDRWIIAIVNSLLSAATHRPRPAPGIDPSFFPTRSLSGVSRIRSKIPNIAQHGGDSFASYLEINPLVTWKFAISSSDGLFFFFDVDIYIGYCNQRQDTKNRRNGEGVEYIDAMFIK